MKCLKKVRPIIRFLVVFLEIASKFEKFTINFSSFSLFPSVATNDSKQNKRRNMVLNNIWNLVAGKTYLGF